MATQWLHKTKSKKARYRLNSRLFNVYMGWLMGLEPTTTGITILTLYHLPLLIDDATINMNQQLMKF
jgi:putative component of toxin-antitoxin plasmid stabilization module